MLTARKTVAVILGLTAALFALGIAVAPPPGLGPIVILVIPASAMATGAVLLWPRRTWRLPDDLLRDGEGGVKPSGPAPLRFGRLRYLNGLNLR